MIVDITNEVLTKLKTELTPIQVLAEYPDTVSDFPCVTISELSNTGDILSKDSGGFNYSIVSLEINVFTTGATRKSKAKEIRNDIDAILSDEYGMLRDFGGQTPNFDTNVYRYTLRYTGRVNEERKIFRG